MAGLVPVVPVRDHLNHPSTVVIGEHAVLVEDQRGALPREDPSATRAETARRRRGTGEGPTNDGEPELVDVSVVLTKEGRDRGSRHRGGSQRLDGPRT